MKSTVTFFATMGGGVIADVVSKWLVFSHIEQYGKITLVPGFLNLVKSKNEGVVFGLFPGKTNFFIIMSVIAIAAIIFIYVKSDKKLFVSNFALGLVLAGAMGNLWDRICYKSVRDFIDLHVGSTYHWPTFNIADSLICIGIAFMVFSSFSFSKSKSSN